MSGNIFIQDFLKLVYASDCLLYFQEEVIHTIIWKKPLFFKRFVKLLSAVVVLFTAFVTG